MTRIVHLIPHDGIGGVEEAARFLARSLPPEDYQLILIAGPKKEPQATIQAGKFSNPLSPFAIWDTVRRVRMAKPEILLFSLWKSVPAAFLSALLTPSSKLVFTLNSLRTANWADRVMSFIALWLADEVWADSSETLRGRAPNHPGGRVVDHFLPMEPTAGVASPPAPSFIVWARMDRDKGLDRGIDLIAWLVEHGLDASYTIIGPDSGYGPALKDQVRRLNLDERVTFLGPMDRHDIVATAKSATFFLMPSRLEGMALATMEAMQLGLIPVVTSVGEMKVYVRNGINGLVLDPDEIPKVGHAIMDLLKDQSSLAAISKAARMHWFGHADLASQIGKAADQLLGKQAQSAKDLSN